MVNLEKHGIDFADAAEIFQGQMVIALDRRLDYGEVRFIGFGALKGRAMASQCHISNPGNCRLPKSFQDDSEMLRG